MRRFREFIDKESHRLVNVGSVESRKAARRIRRVRRQQEDESTRELRKGDPHVMESFSEDL